MFASLVPVLKNRSTETAGPGSLPGQFDLGFIGMLTINATVILSMMASEEVLI